MTDYDAVRALILENTEITGKLDTYYQKDGTPLTEKLVIVGSIPEEQPGLPAISIRNRIEGGRFGISENFIDVYCYAKDEPDSRELAKLVFNYFRDSIGGVDGFAAKFEATITGSTPDKDVTGTIVELKLDYR